MAGTGVIGVGAAKAGSEPSRKAEQSRVRSEVMKGLEWIGFTRIRRAAGAFA
jgi:hypothetical protein